MKTGTTFFISILIICSCAKQVNFVINGDFSNNLCRQAYCIWNTTMYNSENIAGWIPDPQIQIGRGNFYSTQLENKEVLQLSGTKNTCVKQIFETLNSGFYNLNIFYTAHKKRALQDCQFSIYFNQKQVRTIVPTSYHVVNTSISVKLQNQQKNIELKICGRETDRNDGYGTILTKVELWGESSSYLRKEQPLKLKSRSARLLSTLAAINLQLPTNSAKSSNTSTTSSTSTKVSTSAVLPAVSISSPTVSIPNLISTTLQTVSLPSPTIPTVNINLPTVNVAAPTISTVNLNSPVPSVLNLTSPTISMMSPTIPMIQKVTSNSTQTKPVLQTTVNLISNISSSAANVPSINAILSSINASMPGISVTPSIVNLSATNNTINVTKTDLETTNSLWVQSKSTITFNSSQLNNSWTSNSTCAKVQNNSTTSNLVNVTKNNVTNEIPTQNASNQENKISLISNIPSNISANVSASSPSNISANSSMTQKFSQNLIINGSASNPQNLTNSIQSSSNLSSLKITQNSSERFNNSSQKTVNTQKLTAEDEKDIKQQLTQTKNNTYPVSINNQQTKLKTQSSNSQLQNILIPSITNNTSNVKISTINQKQTLLAKENVSVQKQKQSTTKQSQPLLNLIKNGDFEFNSCKDFPCLISSSVSSASLGSWIPEPLIEVGLLKQYNPLLKVNSDNIGVHLGFSTKNTCMRQLIIGLTNQYYDLTFDHAPVLSQPSNTISETFFIVKFNGRNVKNVLSLDQASHQQSIVVKGIKGENIIQFCAFGSINTNNHGSIIDNISLTLKPDMQNMKTNFIVNGDFEENSCTSKSCLWNQNNFNSKNLVGWLPQPQIQIGKGTLYNSHAGISTVAELSPNSNSCMKQIIDNCVPGSFKLEFSWTARESEALHDSIFQVKLNNNVVQSYIPNDYMMHRETIVINLNQGKNELKFCSYGMNNNKGAILDDVGMFLIDSCKDTYSQKVASQLLM